jgi:hypothetical protein
MSISEKCDAASHGHFCGPLLRSSDSTQYLLRKFIRCGLHRFPLSCWTMLILWSISDENDNVGDYSAPFSTWLVVITPAKSSLLFITRLLGAVRSFVNSSIIGHLGLGLQGCLVNTISYKILVSIYHIFLSCDMSTGPLAFRSGASLGQKIINTVPGWKVYKIKKIISRTLIVIHVSGLYHRKWKLWKFLFIPGLRTCASLWPSATSVMMSTPQEHVQLLLWLAEL